MFIRSGQLSRQSIKALCQPYREVTVFNPTKWYHRFLKNTINEPRIKKKINQYPMIENFVPDKVIAPNGLSYGLSAASYDVRIAHDLNLGPLGSENCCGLAHTIERFCMPDNVSGFPFDKSSYARRFIFAMNTFFDPGFSGIQENGKPRIDENGNEDPYASAVLEMVNFGKHEAVIKAGDPICQFIFFWLDQTTDKPYRGKYSAQQGTVGCIEEKSVASHPVRINF